MSQTTIGQDSSVVFYRNVEITGQHELTFSSQSAQQSYFANRLVTSVANTSYVQHNGVLKVTGSPALLGTCNFISFTNPRYEGITIYAAITDIAYVNNSTVKVSYMVDWWQTFMFKANYMPCQMRRESIEASIQINAQSGANPVLDTRLYKTCNSAPERWFHEKTWSVSGWNGNGNPDDLYVCMAISPFIVANDKFPDLKKWLDSFTMTSRDQPTTNFHMTCVNLFPSEVETSSFGPGVKRDKPNGTCLYCFKPNTKNPALYFTGFNNKNIKDGTIMDVGIQLFAAANMMHQIIGVYYLTGEVLYSLMKPLTFSYTYQPWYKEFPFNSAPYNYFGVRSPNGNVHLYQYELFNHYQVSFKMQSSFAGGLTTSFVPIGYRGLSLDFDNRIDVADWPQVPYNVDGYLETMGSVVQGAIQSYAHTNSLFNAHENASIDVVRTAIGAITGLVGGAISGASSGGAKGAATAAATSGAGGVQQVAQSMWERQQYEQATENAFAWSNGGNDTSDRTNTAIAYGQQRFVPGSASALYQMTGMKFVPLNVVPTHDVYTTDNYVYDNFGMETTRVGLPYVLKFQGFNTNGTPSFNDNNPRTTYVQTGNMHCYGLPVIAINFINNLFNGGATFILGDGR